MTLSFDFMIRGDGVAVIQLSTNEPFEINSLYALAKTNEGNVIPVSISSLDLTSGSKLVLSLPLFSSKKISVELFQTQENGVDALLWKKTIGREQLKWASRLAYRTKRRDTLLVRDVSHLVGSTGITVLPLWFYESIIPGREPFFTLKGEVWFSLDHDDVALSLINGKGERQNISFFEGDTKIATSASGKHHCKPFTIRLPKDNSTYIVSAQAVDQKVNEEKSPQLLTGFLCLDPVSKARLHAGHDPHFYKISWDDNYRKWHLDQTIYAPKKQTNGSVKFSIVVPLFKTPPNFLSDMIASVCGQTYQNWELILVNASPEDPQLKNSLRTLLPDDERIIVHTLDQNYGIAENTNAGIRLATGDFICFLDHDDLLAPDALEAYSSALKTTPGAKVIYCDEDLFSTGELPIRPHFKSDFNIDLLRCHNYITHFLAVETKLAQTLLLNPEYDGAQDYDFILRLSEAAGSFIHVPRVLYHWRVHERSTTDSADAKPYANEAGRSALQAHLDRCGLAAKVQFSETPFVYKTEYALPEDKPLISILIPNKDNSAVLERCINSLFECTRYQNFEVIVIENNSTEDETFALYRNLESDTRFESRIKVVTWEREFNYSAINNFGAQFAQGDYLLLLNNDIEAISPEWLGTMLSVAQRSDVGAVGAKLLFPDDTIQHAGITMLKCFDSSVTGGPAHIYANLERDDPGFWGRALVRQDVTAVTGACLLTKKALFNEIGGFDETYTVALNDVDLCLRIREAGYLVVFEPDAVLYHYESLTRGPDNNSSSPENYARFLHEQGMLRDRWSNYYAQGDPYYTFYCLL